MTVLCRKCQFDNPEKTRFCGNCGTSLSLQEEVSLSSTKTLQMLLGELATGSTFAERYLVIEELGRGGMGRVYRVLDKKLDVEIALKLLKPEIASDQRTIERFKNELKLARMISHSHVCRMFDLSEAQGNHFITMEYVPGEDLKNTIQRLGPLSIGKVLSIAKQICEGLAVAHRLDIIHRDLKPQNIMIDQKGNVRIMDFGISRSLKARGITADGIMIGTPEYISPEQAEGSKVDPRSDIYSLGAVLFEMVTGRVPFEGDTTLSIVLKQKLEPPPDPRRLNPQVPKEISQVILKCLEKERERRYANAEALYSELEKIEKALFPEEPGRARRKEEKTAARKSYQKFMIPGIVSLAALMVVGGFFLIKSAREGKPGAGEEKKPAVASEQIPKEKTELAQRASQDKKDLTLPAPSEKTESDQQASLKKVDSGSQPPQKSLTTTPPSGSIEISALPEGAGIYLNNAYKGKAPLISELSPGTYKIQLKKSPEYKELADSFTVKAGEKVSKQYTLVPVYILEIRTVPEGADVFIDGVLKGKAPLKIELSRNVGNLEIKKGEEWLSHSESFNLKPGINSIQRFLQQTPKSIKYNLFLKTNPAEARISIDNGPFALSPVNKQVGPGVYSIKIEKEGFRAIQESVKVEADLEKTFELTKLQPAKIRFNVQPFADVYINDRLIGEVPPVNTQEVPEGKYSIKFVSSRLNKTVNVEVEVKSGEGKEIRVNMVTGESKITEMQKVP